MYAKIEETRETTAEKEAEQILEIEIEKSIQEDPQRSQASKPSSQGPLPDLKDPAYFSNQKRYLLLTGDSTKDTVLIFSFFIWLLLIFYSDYQADKKGDSKASKKEDRRCQVN